jgi:hypothetical protein
MGLNESHLGDGQTASVGVVPAHGRRVERVVKGWEVVAAGPMRTSVARLELKRHRPAQDRHCGRETYTNVLSDLP